MIILGIFTLRHYKTYFLFICCLQQASHVLCLFNFFKSIKPKLMLCCFSHILTFKMFHRLRLRHWISFYSSNFLQDIQPATLRTPVCFKGWCLCIQRWGQHAFKTCCVFTSEKADLSDGGLVVRQTQEEYPGLVDLHRNGPASPLHLAHRGRLLGSCLSDQSLRGTKHTLNIIPSLWLKDFLNV